MRRLGSRVGVLAPIAACVVALLGAAPAAAGADACSDVAVIGSRGSGESWNSGAVPGFGRTLSAQYARVRAEVPRATFTAHANPYPAVAIDTVKGIRSLLLSRAGYYYDSVRQGAAAATGLVEHIARECPRTRIVLMGYSQGAHVSGLALQRLSTSTSSHVAAVINFGDPMFNPSSRHASGNFNRARHGLLGRAAPSTSVPVFSVCSRTDFICQGSRFRWGYLPWRDRLHGHYAYAGVSAAGDFMADVLRRTEAAVRRHVRR